MRKILPLCVGVAVSWGAVGSAGAGAETTLRGSVKMTPNRARTEQRPQGVKLTVAFSLTTLGGGPHPTVTGFEIWHGPGLAFDRGKGYEECAISVFASGGPDACPPKSILSRSSGTAAVDTLEPQPKFVIVNSPGRVPAAYITLQRPARVRAVTVPSVVDRPRSAWAHRTAWTVPESLRVVAGIPITWNELRLSYGFTEGAPLFVASTSCPRGGWRWRVLVHTDTTGTLRAEGAVACRR